MECKKLVNLKKCNCSYPGCPRKGICCECIRYPLAKNQLPACYFPSNIEKTYDRSFENFIRTRK